MFVIWFVYLFQVSILPPLASIFVTNVAAQFADNSIANGVETTTVWRYLNSHLRYQKCLTYFIGL